MIVIECTLQWTCVIPQRTGVSKLQRTLYQLCQGERRNLMDDDEPGQTVYDIVHIPLL